MSKGRWQKFSPQFFEMSSHFCFDFALYYILSFYHLLLCVLLPARRYASTGTSYGHVSACLSQVGVLSKRLNELRWFLARELPSTCPNSGLS